MWQDTLNTFMEKEVGREYTRAHDASREFPWEVYQKMGKLGWLGLRWLGLGGEEAPGEPLQVTEPAVPLPAAVPLPPRRAVQSAPVKPQASLAPADSPYGALPKVILGAQDIAPEGFMAYAP